MFTFMFIFAVDANGVHDAWCNEDWAAFWLAKNHSDCAICACLSEGAAKRCTLLSRIAMAMPLYTKMT